jgi:integrase
MSTSRRDSGRFPPPTAKTSWRTGCRLNASALAILKTLRAEADRILAAREARRDGTSAALVYVLDGARGKRQQAEAAATFTVENFRGHDLRRTAASMMASGGIPRLTIAKILNHVERSVTVVYDRHGYDPEKRSALDWWDAKLTDILRNAQRGPARVVSINARA